MRLVDKWTVTVGQERSEGRIYSFQFGLIEGEQKTKLINSGIGLAARWKKCFTDF